MKEWLKGYQTQQKTVSIDQIEVVGDVPAWLQGILTFTGPALFEVDGQSVGHWFNGYAMLKSFQFDQGRVSFKNAFIESHEYLANVKKVDVDKVPFDNGDVNVYAVGDHNIAMTESPCDNLFSHDDLSTLGHADYKGDVPAHLLLAHPVVDPVSKKWVNVAIEFGQKNQYRFFEIDSDLNRRVIACYESDSAFYIHSFFVTEHYCVLLQSPLIIDLMAMQQGVEFDKAMHFDDNAPVQFVVINKETGVIDTYPIDFALCYHQANGFEQDGCLYLDLCLTHEKVSYQALDLAEIAKGRIAGGEHLYRCCIDLQDQSVRFEKISDMNMEFPRINKAYHGLPSRFVYLARKKNDNMFGSLVKADMQAQITLEWDDAHCYAGEPIFVASPNASSEDEGVVLSIVYDAKVDLSFLLILNAQDWTECARVYVPLRLPFSLHGDWFSPQKS